MMHPNKDYGLRTERIVAQQRGQSVANSFARLNKIEKPCCECLSTKPVVMHHIDYDRPYLVAFMCDRCHRAEHAGKLQRPYRLHDLIEMVGKK